MTSQRIIMTGEFQPTPSLRRATRTWPSRPLPPEYFNPRPPCGGRHRKPTRVCCHYAISTHALLAEGDRTTEVLTTLRQYFNPRPPCGGRLIFGLPAMVYKTFQPTPSLRRATVNSAKIWVLLSTFQPTPSLRRATAASVRGEPHLGQFQPTPSLRRATRQGRASLPSECNFNPRPPCGGRPSAG